MAHRPSMLANTVLANNVRADTMTIGIDNGNITIGRPDFVCEISGNLIILGDLEVEGQINNNEIDEKVKELQESKMEQEEKVKELEEKVEELMYMIQVLNCAPPGVGGPLYEEAKYSFEQKRNRAAG